MKRQVDRPEQVSEPLRLVALITHSTRVPPAIYIVNPDRFPALASADATLRGLLAQFIFGKLDVGRDLIHWQVSPSDLSQQLRPPQLAGT